MDVLVYIALAFIVFSLILLLNYVKKSNTKVKVEDDHGDEDNQVNVRAMPARPAEMAGGMRRTGRRRMQHNRAEQDEDSDEEESMFDDGTGKKVGVKKQKKLEDKAERKAQREAMEGERRERKEREALLDDERKKQDAKDKAEEDRREEEEKQLREEREAREHEEYLKLKEEFTVEEEGRQEDEEEGDVDSILQDFINYIRDMKVIMLEDLAAHFKIKTQDTIDRINTLLGEGRLSGVMDDRGKFIYIMPEEYEAVAKFISQRGRVSISDLAESSNRLINMNPENLETHRKLVGELSS